jgi:flavin-dependent dehydrogenase
MKNFDVVIVGAGLAGLQCARLLSRQGAKILLVDRKTDLSRGIHTTGIFVRKTFEDFEFPAGTLGKPVRNVTLYSPKLKKLDLQSEKDEFRVGKMGLIYKEFLQECLENGVEFKFGTRYVSAETKSDETIVKFEKKGAEFEVRAKVLVGADGANSRVAKDLRLDENREFIVGCEEVFRGVALSGEPRLHCFLDSRLAPGYLAWITNDGEEVHVGVGGYAKDFNPREALNEFRESIAAQFIDLNEAELAETRGGKIPVGGVLQKIACRNGLLIGDAAGAVSPLTAGGLDPCMRLSTFAANVIRERLQSGDAEVLLKYSGKLFRSRFVSRLWMRRIISIFTNQTFLELGFVFLRGKIGRRLAKHIFFGRGSFPDIEIQASKPEVEVI